MLDNMQDSGGPSMIESPEGTLKTLLKEVASSLETPKLLPMCKTSYLISCDASSGLVWDELSKERACLHSNLSTLEIDGLVTNPFVEVRHITSHTDTFGMMVSYILPVALNGSLQPEGLLELLGETSELCNPSPTKAVPWQAWHPRTISVHS